MDDASMWVRGGEEIEHGYEAEEAEEEEESINPCPCRSARSDGHRVSPIAHHSSFMDKTDFFC
jgi:hypothetical protein